MTVCVLKGICTVDVEYVEDKIHHMPAFYRLSFVSKGGFSLCFHWLMQTLKPCCVTFYFEFLFPAHDWCMLVSAHARLDQGH